MAARFRFLPESPLRDPSLHGILLGNLFTLAAAVTQHWPLAPLMWIYWGQSVVIGALNVVRMLSLKEFSTDGFTSGGVQPPPTRATAIQTAAFFALHYGFFHFGYLVFLLAGAGGGRIDARAVPSVVTATIVFALAHSYSLWRNHGRDFRDRKPNLGALMFYPYVRILPMHLTIIFGSMIAHAALPLFVLLKTGADGGMHLIEHALFRGTGEPVTPEAAPGDDARAA